MDGNSQDPVGSGTGPLSAEAANRALQDAQWAEQNGLPERAVDEYRKVVAGFPGIFEVHNNLANLLLGLGRIPEALDAAQAACALRPQDPLVNANLGQALLRLDRPGEAVPHLMLALQQQPDVHPVRNLLATALLEAGRGAEGAALFREIEGRFPNDFPLLAAMARFYYRAKQGVDAERCLLRMRQLNPQHLATYGDLAQLYMDYSQFSKANEVARDGLRLDPKSTVLWNTLANSQASLGRIGEAIVAYRKVLELAPDLSAAHSNLLLTMHYPSDIDPGALFEEHRNFGSRHAPPALATRTFRNAPEPERRLRIGFLSPDIRTHSVAFFLEPLLDHLDRTRFELYCYPAVKTPDTVTQRLRSKFDRYRSVLGLPHPQIAAMIREDQIDILVDLAGHAGTMDAAVLGYKPAPVQATWLGYPDTTGIDAVDYRITDWISDPPGAEGRHVEELVRLPGGFLCFGPPERLPAIGPPPVIANRFVTFGSFNREFKVSQKAYDLWCRILATLPDSRIVMKSVAGDDPTTREHQLGEFERRGVARDRVQLVGFIASQMEHLGKYREIDIALDTFPYHGTTTTLDALLMGVPVITLAGYNHASRVGASLLTQVGIPECIGRDEDDYVARAVGLATDLDRLMDLHGTLRDRLLASTLCNGPEFARKFEFALRGMWLRWCRSRGMDLTPEQSAAAALDFGAESSMWRTPRQ